MCLYLLTCVFLGQTTSTPTPCPSRTPTPWIKDHLNRSPSYIEKEFVGLGNDNCLASTFLQPITLQPARPIPADEIQPNVYVVISLNYVTTKLNVLLTFRGDIASMLSMSLQRSVPLYGVTTMYQLWFSVCRLSGTLTTAIYLPVDGFGCLQICAARSFVK